MSHEGKMKRGLKWWNHRDREGNLPKGIKEDQAKMDDINYYLENSKKEI
jgi:hypothetical protein